ncbi:unnamed protein product, partial [Agarophyton chilense]
MQSSSLSFSSAFAALPPTPEALTTVVRQVCESSCLRSWKIGFAAILLAEGLLFAHIVYFAKRVSGGAGSRFLATIRIGNAFSAGIFLATGFLHVLPEAVELLSGEDSHDAHARLLRKSVRLLSQFVREDDDHHEGEGHEEHEDEEGHSELFPWAYLITVLTFYLIFFVEKILIPKLLPSPSTHDAHVKDLEQHSEEGHQISSSKYSQGFGSRAFIQGLVEVIAISLHSLFESMALGLSSSFDVMLNIFIATAAHRWATSAALSFKLVRDLRYVPFLVLMTLFSAAVPVGIAIGAVLSSLSATVQGVLFSLSAGTFLYIGGFE